MCQDHGAEMLSASPQKGEKRGESDVQGEPLCGGIPREVGLWGSVVKPSPKETGQSAPFSLSL